MNLNRILFSVAAYLLITFPLAVLWHIGLFEDLCFSFGYFDSEPNFLIGLFSILCQGIILAISFPLIEIAGSPLRKSMIFVLLAGSFFWTSHVLAFMAKQSVTNALLFAVMETGYLVVQFGLYGILLGFIYSNKK